MSTLECSICLNKILRISDIVTLQCEHKFHKVCLAIWAGDPKKERDKNKGCPMCRGPLEVKREPNSIRKNGGTRRRKKSKKIKSRKLNIKKTKARKLKGKKTKNRKLNTRKLRTIIR